MASLIPLPTDDSRASSPPINNNIVCAPVASAKLRRFRFAESYDMSLLKAVRSVNAHIPKWGKAEALYDEALTAFLRDIPVSVFEYSQKPSAKTITDIFKRLAARRREEVKRNTAASGIHEEYGEKEVLLDDLIGEIDEKEEARRAEKEIQNNNEKKLVAAGENIRVRPLKRKTEESDDAEEVNSNSAKKRRARRLECSNSDDEITAAIIRQGETRKEMENGRLELMRRQMEWEERKAKKEEDRFERTQDVANKRLDLDEKRFALEKVEREQSLLERKKMVDVMAMLCKKLE